MQFETLDFDAFHRQELPRRLAAGNGRLAADDVADVPPIAFQIEDGRAWQYAAQRGTIAVAPGVAGAGTIVALSASAWSDFAHELATGAGLVYGRRAAFTVGSPADLERWEPALRAMFHGRPILDPLQTEARDLAGRPLDPRQTFALGDPDHALREFLAAAGFLRVCGVFSPGEVERLRTEVERLERAARPGDGRSWWAGTADGRQVCCRLTYAGLESTVIAALDSDPRVRRLIALVDPALEPVRDRADGHSVVLKHGGVTQGLSDLPWHRDCGMGGHPVMCPTLNIGVQLDAATAAAGRLSFLPGSWRGSLHRSVLSHPDLPVVAVDTEPGDCTIHVGDVLHAAPSPTAPGAGRRALYLSCLGPAGRRFIPAGQSYNDTILPHVGH